jgi:hypothetical protein
MERDEEGPMRSENPGAVVSGALPQLEPLRSVRADALEVAYFEAGPSDGEVEHLLHGSPYDIHSYVDVIPRLVEAGHRVITPYLRGHGPTRFLDSTAPRSGQQAAIGTDVVALMDVLEIPRAIFAGYDWGRPRLGQQLSHPGRKPHHDADPARPRSWLLVLLLLPS